MFVADEGKPVVWRLNSSGDVVTEKTLSIEGMGQVAKIRKDASSGFVLCSTAYASLGGADRNVMALVKLDTSLTVEWSQVDIRLNSIVIYFQTSDLRTCWWRDPGV